MINNFIADHHQGNSHVYLMDCVEFMKQFPDGFFNVAIVDPPYGLGRSAFKGGGIMRERKLVKMDTTWDKRPSDEYFSELFRISCNQIIWGGNYFSLPPSRGFVIWDKKQPFETFSRAEFAWLSFQVPSKIFEFDSRSYEKIHPTEKPVKLYEWLLFHYTKFGDRILDTHLGSQNSRIAAWNSKLEFWGSEINHFYFYTGCKNFENHSLQLSLF